MSLARKVAVIAVTLIGLLAINYVFEHGFGDFQINPYYARIINLIGINITLAVSLNLINGLAGQFSIGHAGFMAVGGYTATYVTVYHGRQIAATFGSSLADPLGASAAMVPSLLAGATAAALAGLIVGIPSLRLKGDYLAIVTLGFSEIIRVIILNIPAVGGATGFTDAIPITNFFWIFAMAIVTIVITVNIAHSTFGLALFAIRSDEIAAEAMGINTTRHKVLAFVISAALAGVAGGLSGQLFANPLSPQNLNFVKSIEVIVMIVLGGIGSITGAVLGATTLTILPEALRTFDQQFPGLRMVIYALLLILLMIFRPQGLLGRREFSWAWMRPGGRRSWHRADGPERDHALRRADGGQVAQHERAAVVALWAHRSERRRQNDGVQRADGRLLSHRRRYRVRWDTHREEEAVRDYQAWRGQDVPEHPPVCGHDSPAERDDRPAPADASDSGGRGHRHRRGTILKSATRAPARWSC